jgi:hypothetical protein
MMMGFQAPMFMGVTVVIMGGVRWKILHKRFKRNLMRMINQEPNPFQSRILF